MSSAEDRRSMWRDWARRIGDWVWERDLEQAGALERTAFTTIRLTHALIRRLWDGQLTLRAMSLVYTTLLTVVPLLAFSVSLLAAFGVHNVLRPVLVQLLLPLGSGTAGKVADHVIALASNIKIGVLGVLGLALLLFAVVSLLHKIEQDLNHIWRIARARTLHRRFSDYLSVLLIGPVLLVTGMGISSNVTESHAFKAMTAVEPFGFLVYAMGWIAPYVLIAAAFTFIYIFLPNTSVRLGPALTGGVVAGVAWLTASRIFAVFVVSSGSYSAIYSGFAIVILLLLWIYVGWVILLVGAQIAFYRQRPEYLRRVEVDPRPSAGLQERLALLVLCLVGERHMRDADPWTEEALAAELRVMPELLFQIADRLVAHRLLVKIGPYPFRLLPARELDTITVLDLLHAVRRGDAMLEPKVPAEPPFTTVQDVFEGIAEATEQALDGMTIKDLVRAPRAHPPQEKPAAHPTVVHPERRRDGRRE